MGGVNNQFEAHIDGDMKLVRYDKNSQSDKASYFDTLPHRTLFVASNEEMVNRVAELDIAAKTKSSDEARCGTTSWTAAMNSTSSKKGLAECGVQIGTCGHGCPQCAVPIYKSGEKFGHTYMLLEQYYKPKGVKIIHLDVACRFQKTGYPGGENDWVTRVEKGLNIPPYAGSAGGDDRAREVVFCLPCWHSTGHMLHCGILRNTRWYEGHGNADGEDGERTNWYLSLLSSNLKNTSAANWRTGITLGAIYVGDMKARSLARQLSI